MRRGTSTIIGGTRPAKQWAIKEWAGYLGGRPGKPEQLTASFVKRMVLRLDSTAQPPRLATEKAMPVRLTRHLRPNKVIEYGGPTLSWRYAARCSSGAFLAALDQENSLPPFFYDITVYVRNPNSYSSKGCIRPSGYCRICEYDPRRMCHLLCSSIGRSTPRQDGSLEPHIQANRSGVRFDEGMASKSLLQESMDSGRAINFVAICIGGASPGAPSATNPWASFAGIEWSRATCQVP